VTTVSKAIRRLSVIKKILLFFIVFIVVVLIYLNFFNKESCNKIVLGASLPQSGINKELGKEIVEGANSYFSHINARGGIGKKHIDFIFYDDKYEPQNTIKNTKRLIEKDRAFALFGFVGTPTTKVIMPILYTTHIPFIAPYTGASFLRDTDFPNIVNFRSSYKEEIEEIVKYLHDKKGLSKFSIFYQNDDYGEEGYIATIEALKRRGLTLVSEGTYKRNTLSIRHAIHEIKSKKPEVLIMVGACKASARFIKKTRECCFSDVIFAPISFVNANALIEELNGNGNNIIFSQTVPAYEDTTLKIAREYLKLLKFYYPKAKPTYASFESFLAANLVVKALQRTKNNITRKNFLYELKHLPKDILGKIPIHYKHTQLLNRVYLSTYENGKFKLLKKYIK
jgi:ABC-type branched-subunit amino acid transport system substrate-binding protein